MNRVKSWLWVVAMLSLAALSVTTALAQQTPRAYMVVDASGSMVQTVKVPGDTVARQRFELISRWVVQHAAVELAAGNEVVIVPFNDKVLPSRSFRGVDAVNDIRQMLEAQRLRINKQDGTRIWDALAAQIQSMGDATPGSSIAVYTDGEDEGSKWTEQGCMALLKDAVRMPEHLDLNLRILRWTKEMASGVVPPTATAELSGPAIVTFDRRDLADGMKIKVPVRLIVSESAGEADGVVRVVASLVRVSGDSTLKVSANLSGEVSKRRPDGEVELVVQADDIRGPSIFQVQFAFLFRSTLEGIAETEREQRLSPKRLLTLDMKVRSPALEDLFIEPPMVRLLSGATSDLEVKVRGNKDAAGEPVSVRVSLPAGIVGAVIDSSGKVASMSSRLDASLRLDNTASGLVRLRVRADSAGEGTIEATAALDGSAPRNASCRVVANQVTVTGQVVNRTLVTDLSGQKGEEWTRLGAGPLRVATLPQQSNAEFDVVLSISRVASDLDLAFDDKGSLELRVKSRDLPKDVPLLVRWSAAASQFRTPSMPSIRMSAVAAAGISVSVPEPLIDMRGFVKPLDAEAWIVDSDERRTDQVILPLKRMVVSTSDGPAQAEHAASFRIGWNRVLSGKKVLLAVETLEPGVLIDSSSVTFEGGVVSNSRTGELTLGPAGIGTIRVPVRPGDLSRAATVKCTVRPGPDVDRMSTLVATCPYELLPRPLSLVEGSESPPPQMLSLDRPKRIGTLRVQGTGRPETISVSQVAIESPDLAVRLGFGDTMDMKAVVPARLDVHEMPVFAALSTTLDKQSRSKLAAKMFETRVVFSAGESSSHAPLASWKFSVTPRVWKLILARDGNTITSWTWSPLVTPVLDTRSRKPPTLLKLDPPGESRDIDDVGLSIELKPKANGLKPAAAAVAGFAMPGATPGDPSSSAITVARLAEGVGVVLKATSAPPAFRFWSSSTPMTLVVRSSDNELNLSANVTVEVPATLPPLVWPVALVVLLVAVVSAIRTMNERKERRRQSEQSSTLSTTGSPADSE